jgi:shikimate kinase
LAKAINYHYFDMDVVIQELEQMSVAEIFETHGEDYFRKLERKVLKTLPIDNRLVVSTGGGVPCFFDNMAIIKASGTSVFLDLSPAILMERMQSSKKNDRPHYNQADPMLLENLTQRYEYRLQYYTQADHRIVGSTTLEAILELLKNKNGLQD